MRRGRYGPADAATVPSRGLLEHYSSRVIAQAWPLLGSLFALLVVVDLAGDAPRRWAGAMVNALVAAAFVGVGTYRRRRPSDRRAPEIAGVLGLTLVLAATAAPLASGDGGKLVFLPLALTMVGFLALSRRWLGAAMVAALVGLVIDILLVVVPGSAAGVDLAAAAAAAGAMAVLLNAVLSAMLGAAETAWAKSDQMAVADQLTGVANRRGFYMAADEAIRAATVDGNRIAVAYVDVDGLKAINDVHGHAAGDEAIRSAAGALVEAADGTGTVARLGGDEFAWILPGDDAEPLRRSVLDAAAGRAAIPGTPLRISVGVVISRSGESLDALLVRADAAMYAVKAQRKGQRRAAPRVASPPVSESSGTSATR